MSSGCLFSFYFVDHGLSFLFYLGHCIVLFFDFCLVGATSVSSNVSQNTSLLTVLCIRPSRDGPYYVIGAGGRPHRFPHNNFSSVYRIFTKLGHMITMWKGKNPIYFGVIRSKVKVTIEYNQF